MPWNHRNINYLNVDITQRYISITFTSIITTEQHVHKRTKKKIKPKYIAEGWIDIIKIRFLTGHHVSYRSPCILQVTMYLTGYYVSYRSPYILQVTMYLTDHHISYRSSCILQVTMYLTGHHVSYRSPCILQVTMCLTGHHVSFMLHSLHGGFIGLICLTPLFI